MSKKIIIPTVIVSLGFAAYAYKVNLFNLNSLTVVSDSSKASSQTAEANSNAGSKAEKKEANPPAPPANPTATPVSTPSSPAPSANPPGAEKTNPTTDKSQPSADKSEKPAPASTPAEVKPAPTEAKPIPTEAKPEAKKEESEASKKAEADSSKPVDSTTPVATTAPAVVTPGGQPTTHPNALENTLNSAKKVVNKLKTQVEEITKSIPEDEYYGEGDISIVVKPIRIEVDPRLSELTISEGSLQEQQVCNDSFQDLIGQPGITNSDNQEINIDSAETYKVYFCRDFQALRFSSNYPALDQYLQQQISEFIPDSAQLLLATIADEGTPEQQKLKLRQRFLDTIATNAEMIDLSYRGQFKSFVVYSDSRTEIDNYNSSIVTKYYDLLSNQGFGLEQMLLTNGEYLLVSLLRQGYYQAQQLLSQQQTDSFSLKNSINSSLVDTEQENRNQGINQLSNYHPDSANLENDSSNASKSTDPLEKVQFKLPEIPDPSSLSQHYDFSLLDNGEQEQSFLDLISGIKLTESQNISNFLQAGKDPLPSLLRNAKYRSNIFKQIGNFYPSEEGITFHFSSSVNVFLPWIVLEAVLKPEFMPSTAFVNKVMYEIPGISEAAREQSRQEYKTAIHSLQNSYQVGLFASK